MVTDGQVSELRRWLAKGKPLAAAARMASMDNKTARSYRDDGRLPSQRKSPRNYRTRVDPFAEVWDEIEQMLQAEPRLKAKTLFDDLQRRYPGRFEESTRRTFERQTPERFRDLVSNPKKTLILTSQFIRINASLSLIHI